MIRICLNFKFQRTKKIYVSSQRSDEFKNLRCETVYIGDYEHLNISSFAVLGIKLWLEEDGDLNRNDPLYSFSRKLKIDTKCYTVSVSFWPLLIIKSAASPRHVCPNTCFSRTACSLSKCNVKCELDCFNCKTGVFLRLFTSMFTKQLQSTFFSTRLWVIFNSYKGKTKCSQSTHCCTES